MNCDQAEIIGAQESLVFRRVLVIENSQKSGKKTSVSLASLTRSITSTDEKNPICINPILLLTRLLVMAEREESFEQYFDFEPTHCPESCFMNQLM